jgi:glutamate-1-semialdehyde 2,1-aminomutase
VGKREILEKTSPGRKVKKWERVLIGGGTFSAHPLTAAAGLAMLKYLRDHAMEVYPALEIKGKTLREGLQKAFHREGINAIVTGISSLFQPHFPFRQEVTLDSPHAIYQFTDIEKREVEFRIRMLTKGIHVMHGGGALSIAHSDEDIDKIIKATRKAAEEMAHP